MADERKGLLEKGAADGLAEGAAYFDRLIESVRLNRNPPSPQAPAALSNPLLSASPGEAWAKEFQTQSIGPEGGRTAVVDFAPLPKWVVVPPPPDAFPAARAFAPKIDLAPPKDFVPEKRFAEPETPRRSWLRRVFLGG